ncbi:MAG: hypothetical protein IB618_01985 [Candidatus Pacearchaeota archaeon]|nr:MAG: hypothetical protein IB618_01985 [Candidatus Pacearchaeota archaeon]
MGKEIFNKILDLVQEFKQISDKQFNKLALEVFSYQYKTNKSYKKYCDRLKKDPSKVDHWLDVPFILTRFFKDVQITNLKDKEVYEVGRTGGTGLPGKVGHIFRDKKTVGLMYTAFSKVLSYYTPLQKNKGRKFLLFYPPEREEVEDLGIAAVKGIGRKADAKFLDSFEELEKEIKKARKSPVDVFLASPILPHLLRKAKTNRWKFPEDTFLIDQGKKRSKGIGKLGILKHNYVNLYGLTEVNSEFCDSAYINWLENNRDPVYRPNLPWTRTIAVHPETLERLQEGKKGLLRHYDLTNLTHCLAIQTDDLGYEIEKGFEVIGKKKGAEAKTCSYVTKELLGLEK